MSTPDFRGGLSDGWASALEAVVTVVPLDAAPARDPGEQAEPPGPEPLAVLAGPSLTAVDIDELAALVRGFGLDPVVVPDLWAHRYLGLPKTALEHNIAAAALAT